MTKEFTDNIISGNYADAIREFKDIIQSKMEEKVSDLMADYTLILGEDVNIQEDTETAKVKAGERPKGRGWSLKRSGLQKNEPHDVYTRKTKRVGDVKEEIEELDETQLDELSRKTLGSYVKKASVQKANSVATNSFSQAFSDKDNPNAVKNMNKRHTGIEKAVGKLVKEDSETPVTEEKSAADLHAEKMKEIQKKVNKSLVKKD